MRGPHQSAMAVRRPDKSITTETWETFSGGKKWYHSVPIVRGCVSFVESLRVGYRCLMRSADLAGYEEEPSAFEKKLIDKFGKKASDALTYLAMLIGVVAAVLLFMVLPAFLVGLLGDLIPDWSRTILGGCAENHPLCALSCRGQPQQGYAPDVPVPWRRTQDHRLL